MKPTPVIRVLLVFVLFHVSIGDCFPAKKDHLAVIPVATEEQQDIISLLECGKPSIDGKGTIRIPVYNPTKYTLNRCIIQVTFPKENISKSYYSEKTAIKPLTDGLLEIQTMILGVKSEEMLYQIHSLSYSETEKE